MFFIGVFTALVACAIDIVIEQVSSQKYRLIKKCIPYHKINIMGHIIIQKPEVKLFLV